MFASVREDLVDRPEGGIGGILTGDDRVVPGGR
jgi:hypothetical protein